MNWKCVCNNENVDERLSCKNCGRQKPKYLGIKLDIDQTQKMDDQQKAIWYLMIADDFFNIASNSLKYYEELKSKVGDERYNTYTVEKQMRANENSVKSNCKECISFLDRVRKLFPEAQFKDSDGMVLSSSTVESQCHFKLGSLYFENEDYENAITYFQKSFDADPNQVSIYNIAMATINLPVESGGMFGGKKRQGELQVKREQELILLKKTVKFAPFSELGRKSARTLIKKYGITDFDI